MQEYVVGQWFDLKDIKKMAVEQGYAMDIGREKQLALRSEAVMDDVVAEFYIEGDKAQCIFNLFDPSYHADIEDF